MIAAVEIMKAGYLYQKEVQNILKPFDISHEQYNVMRILRGAKEEHLSLKEVQGRMMNQTANTTRLVEKLKMKELITSEYCPHNRRRLEIKLTDQGEKLLDTISPTIFELGDRVAKIISSDDADSLIRILKKFKSLA